MLESDGVKNNQRARFQGSYTATKAILSIVFPLVFGSLIYATGFLKSLIIVLLIVVLRIILSFIFKDENIPKGKKANLKKYFELTKNDKRFKQLYKVEFFNGMLYSEAAFSYIVTIYIIKVFSNSFSLGVFTSIFSAITCIIGILFARYIKEKHYVPIIKISMVLTVVLLFLMIFRCNVITIILFNLFQTISKNTVTLINGKNQSNLCNIKEIREEYKVEYWLTTETSLVIARIASSCMFILMAYTNSNIIIIAFAVFLILFASDSIKLQKSIEKEKIV